MYKQVASATNNNKHPMTQLSQFKQSETSSRFQQLQSNGMLLDHSD